MIMIIILIKLIVIINNDKRQNKNKNRNNNSKNKKRQHLLQKLGPQPTSQNLAHFLNPGCIDPKHPSLNTDPKTRTFYTEGPQPRTTK